MGKIKPISRLLVFGVLAVFPLGFAHAASGPAVFEQAPKSPLFQSDSTALRERFVRWKGGLPAAPGVFKPGSHVLRFNLFDDADYSMVLDQVQQRPHGRRTFTVHFQEEPGSIGALTQNGNSITGVFYVLGRGTFKIYPAGHGIHHVVQVNEEGFLCGMNHGHAVLSDAALQATIPQEGMPNLIPNLYPAGCTFAVNPTVLNLAMVYTPAALAAVGGSVGDMEAMVDTMVFYDNLVYANSGINAQVQLVYSGEVNFTESGSMYTDLADMGNGDLPAIQDIMNTYGAVMVNMLVAGKDPVMGLGYQPGHYSMEHVSFPEAMIHETGHNLGCGHDVQNGGPGVYPYSAGARFTSNGVQYRTIMAYAPGVYTPFFSSPSATYLGTATGTANADNVRTINQMAPVMAASVPSVSLDSPTISLASPAFGAVYTGPLTLALSANASDGSGIAQVDFYVDSQYLATAASAPYTINWPLVPSGTHFVTAHAINSLGTGSYSCPASIYVNNSLPASWVGQDIGWLTQCTATNLELKYMGYLGSETYAAGVYTVNGAGNGIGEDLTGVEQDSFHFTSQPSCGYTSLTARLTGLTNGSSGAQAGLMMRDNNADDSPYFFVGWSQDGSQTGIAYRSKQGGSSAWKAGPNLGSPAWFQLTRSGNDFMGLESADGSSWTTLGPATITLSANAGIGFAVSGGNTADLASASFDNVNLGISCVPPTPTSTLSPTVTFTRTWTSTLTPSPTFTLTPTVTLSPTVTPSPTVTYSPTITLSPTITSSPTQTGSPTPTCPAGTGPNLSWSTMAPMPSVRYGLMAGVINGLMYVAGGDASLTASFTNSLEVYNPSTNQWSALASMPYPLYGMGSGVVNSKLYSVGGFVDSGASIGVTNLTLAYNPTSNSWSTLAPLPTARYLLAGGVVNGLLYAVGGLGSAGSALGTVEAFNPAANSWAAEPSMPTARQGPAVGVVNNILYAMGGYNGSTQLTTVEAYDPSTGSWSTKSPMPVAVDGAACGVMSGLLFLAGGETTSGYVNTVQVYNPATDTWTTWNPMPTARSIAAAGVINGVFYVVGGYNYQTSTIYANNEAASIACVAFTPTGTPTVTSTATSTPTQTFTQTPTATNTRTNTPTLTDSPTLTSSPTNTYPPGTDSPTPVDTATATNSPTSTFTGTSTLTPTPTPTPTGTWYTSTPTSTFTQILDGPQPTNTPLPTNTFTASPTVTPTSTATWTFTPSFTSTVTATPSVTSSFSPTGTATFTPSFTDSPTPTGTYVTSTPTPTPSASPTVTSTATSTFTPTVTPVFSSTPIVDQPYPNPVIGDGPVYLNVQAPPGSTVTLDVFTTAFRHIAWNGRVVSGNSILSWDLKDQWGDGVASGLYYLRVDISNDGFSQTQIRKVLVLR